MDAMEGSNDEVIPYIASTVGTLVWVRRRNGSWWPGRILAPEELPGAHLLSPRTGSPVKLLGRADGSVDWYNIEKSRRVKAFRCGEFDECIEKARSLASVLSKKREKYARREDAILHALELEKEFGQRTHLQEKLFSMGLSHGQLSDFVNGGKLLHDDMSAINFQRSLMKPGASIHVDDASSDSLFNLHGHRQFLDVDWGEDFIDSLPHMRGLQDLGLGIDWSNKEKTSWSSAYEQLSHAFVTEEKKKAARRMSMVDGMETNSTRMPKKKRSAQSSLMEDGNMRKKQLAIPGNSDSNGKFVDGTFELGSKVCFSPYTVKTGRNGYAPPLQHKQERIADLLDKVPLEYKPAKDWSGSEGWEVSVIESRCRNEMLSFLPFMDKASPSVVDHQKPSCCSGRPYRYGGSQMEVDYLVASAFVDPLLQGGPAPRTDVNVNTVTLSRHYLSPVAEEDASEGSFLGEDEADLFQQIPGSSLSSPEAICVSASNGQLKQGPLFEDTSNCSKVLVDIASENRVLVDEGWDDESSICAPVESGSLLEEYDDVYEQSLSKWQPKGRRIARATRRTIWGSLPVGLQDGSLEENVGDMASNVIKGVGKRSTRPRRTFDLASCSEGDEELLPTQPSSKVDDHANKTKVCQVSQGTSTYWFEVSVEFQDATCQPLVSIMSELIQKPIVGYSVLVEMIANRSEGPTYVEGSVMARSSTIQPSLQPAWRTARRTATQRIPRSCSTVLSSNHSVKAVGKHQQGYLWKGQNRGTRKKSSRFGSAGMEGGHQKKLALLPQKTRMLSSIAVQNSEKNSEPIGLKVSDAPLVTCIPVNVIFNRIREVLYRKE